MYEGISGRIKAFDFAFLPMSCKVMKKRKIEKINRIDDSQIEEIWERRKKKRGYFKPHQISKTGSSIPSKSSRNFFLNVRKRIPNIWIIFHQTFEVAILKKFI